MPKKGAGGDPPPTLVWSESFENLRRYQGRTADALAQEAEEGRGKLR